MSDELDIDRLYNSYADVIYEFALYSLGNPQHAVQEVFLRALVSLHQFRNDSSVKTWLFVALATTYLTYIAESLRRRNTIRVIRSLNQYRRTSTAQSEMLS